MHAPNQSSLALLERARAGDVEAINILAGRYLPRLQRWASGRLPVWARGLTETQDVVQESVYRAFGRLDAFEFRGEGSLQAYLRQAVLNRIRSEIRNAARRPGGDAVDESIVDTSPTPLEIAVGRETVERYESALGRLRDIDREAVIGHVELGLSNEEIAEALGKPSANAARMAVERALYRLAREMGTS